MTPKITIKDLADCREYVPLVSKWAWLEWSRGEGISLSKVIYRTEHCLTKKCPRTFIVFYGSKPAGTAALWPTDSRLRLDLSPWLSNLYVLPRYRKLGLGQALQEVVIKAARKSGFKKVYLFTGLKGYYEKTGWHFIGTIPYKKRKTARLYDYQVLNK
jgi:GNAT superfamily N-acetyltransferase